VKSGKDFYILGDFNLPKLKHMKYCHRIFQQYSLRQLVSENTRQDALLDLIITNKPDLVFNVSVCNPHISDHSLTDAVITYRRQENTRRLVSYRNFKSLDTKDLFKDLENAPLKSTNDNPEIIVTHFTNEFLKVFDKHAPIITQQFKAERAEKTLSQGTIQLKVERDDAYKVFKISKSQTDKAKFDELNYKVKKAILMDTNEALNLKLEKHGIFPTINTYCKLSRKSKTEPFNIPVNEINDFFVEISTKTYNISSFPSKPDMIVNPENRFKTCKIDLEEMSNVWNSLKKLNSSVYDVNNLCTRMFLQSIANSAAESILHIITTTNTFGIVPNKLKQ